jgi:hypothetical protein
MLLAHQIAPGRSGDKLITVLSIGGRESYGGVGSGTPLVIGAIAFNPSNYTLDNADLSLVFRAVAANGTTPLTTNVRLVNVTDTDTITTLTIVNTTNLVKQETTLTIGAGAGQIDNSEKIYEVQIFVTAPAVPADSIELHSAELRIIHTVK